MTTRALTLAEAGPLMHAHDPDGRRLQRIRWLEAEGTVWLFPESVRRSDLPSATVLAEHAWPLSWPPRRVAMAFWLAQAVRQDLWRALRAVRGFRPVIGVGHRNVVEVTACGIWPGGARALGSDALETVFSPARRRKWMAWAARQCTALRPD